MSPREFKLRVQDMLAEIAAAREIVAGLNAEAFTQNQQALRAVLYSLAVIGEAVGSALPDLEAADPTTPWYQIRGMQ